MFHQPKNIFARSQVVALAEVGGTDNSRLQTVVKR
jgi:hypothetical protein